MHERGGPATVGSQRGSIMIARTPSDASRPVLLVIPDSHFFPIGFAYVMACLEKHGTPFYVYSQGQLITNFRAFDDAFAALDGDAFCRDILFAE